MMKVKISDKEHLIILALLEQAIEDDDCYSEDELKKFEDLYRKLKEVKDDE